MSSKILKHISIGVAAKLPLAVYCRLVNLSNPIRGWSHRISPFEGGQIHKAVDGRDAIYLCRRGRHTRYKRGVLAGAENLAAQYHLDQIDVRAGGLLIDCGANIGELGLWARARKLSYIAFEPEELEAHCADLNNYEGQKRTHRKALWNRNTSLTLFSKPDSADSSLIDMGNAASRRPVEAVRLDSAIDLGDASGPVILKIEGEGAEPEILEGAAALLPKVDFVTVDCGPERGPQRAHTFVETNTLLVDAGFRLQRVEFRRVTALYRNMSR